MTKEYKKPMSEKEYLERISSLYEKIRSEFAVNEDEETLLKRYRDAEFDLTIEYRLGPDFPIERREALRAVHQHVYNQLEELRKRYISGNLQKQEFVDLMRALTVEMAEKFASLLSQEEMAAFFGQGENAFMIPFSSDEIR